MTGQKPALRERNTAHPAISWSLKPHEVEGACFPESASRATKWRSGTQGKVASQPQGMSD